MVSSDLLPPVPFLVRGDAAKASPFPFLRTQSKSDDDFKQQFPTLFLLFGAMHA
jgi:hypothetical protein